MRKFITAAKLWLQHIPKIAGIILDALDNILITIDTINYDKVKAHEIEMLKQLSSGEIATYNMMPVNNKTEMLKAFLDEQKKPTDTLEESKLKDAI